MPAKLRKTDDCLELNLSGDPNFKDSLAKVKSIPGRRFNGEKKVWEFPVEVEIAERVVYTIKPEASAEILGWIKSAKQARAEELTTPLPADATKPLLLPWSDELYGYQRAAVEWMVDHPQTILADDMGLGKTVQAIATVSEYCARRDVQDAPKLVVCPNSVKGVWAREIQKWHGTPDAFVVVHGTKDKRKQQIREGIEKNAWVIVNWEQVRAEKREVTEGGRKKMKEFCKEDLFEQTEWLAVIADEAHRAKNRKALQTRGLWKIDAPLKLALSGTPIMNSPDEIWSILKWLRPKEYTSYWRFFDQYVDSYEGFYGKVIVGVRNPDALRFELSDKLIRRTKGRVLDLPEKVRVVVPVELHPKQRKLYKETEKQLWIEIEKAAKEGDAGAKKLAEAAVAAPNLIYTIPNGAARMVRLRQVACTPALLGGQDISAKLDTAEEIILDQQPKQFVVFSEFVESCNILATRLRKKGLTVATFTGQVSAEERSHIEDRFQAGEIDVVIGTIAAMHLGVTLTAADTALFLEESWVPAVNDQACDRLHRQGQKNNVTILVLQATGTVDDGKISPTNNIKRLIVGNVLEQDERIERTID